MSLYTPEFFDSHRNWSLHSAEQIVPVIVDLVQPRSVVDVGCGDGTWLNVFLKHGIQDVLGIDGDYVNNSTLQIPATYFIPHDLTKPFERASAHQSDLVVSLEVGEHLPPEDAEAYVSTLTRLGEIVLFSAAAPNQGGTHHINEQWPDYWAALFSKCKFDAVDCIRKRVWKDQRIQWYYRQNILLFVKQGHHVKTEMLRQEITTKDDRMLSIIHPDAYDRKQNEVEHWRRGSEEPTLRKVLSSLPAATIRAVKKRI